MFPYFITQVIITQKWLLYFAVHSLPAYTHHVHVVTRSRNLQLGYTKPGLRRTMSMGDNIRCISLRLYGTNLQIALFKNCSRVFNSQDRVCISNDWIPYSCPQHWTDGSFSDSHELCTRKRATKERITKTHLDLWLDHAYLPKVSFLLCDVSCAFYSFLWPGNRKIPLKYNLKFKGIK